MKFAIISDSHDNWPNIEKAIKYLDHLKIDTMIHCGDISSGEVLKQIGLKFNGDIHAILGNVSSNKDTMQRKSTDAGNITLYDETGKIEIDNLKIAFNHYPWEADKLAKSGKYDLVFYGHDHKPWDKQVNKTRMLNPGTLAGLFTKATFAIYDTDTKKAELIILEKI